MYGWWSETVANKYPSKLVECVNSNDEKIECIMLSSFSSEEGARAGIMLMYDGMEVTDLMCLGQVESVDDDISNHKQEAIKTHQEFLDEIDDEESQRGF